MPVENQATVTAWVDETFGPSTSNLRAAARASDEMHELLSALARDDMDQAADYEIADVVICLYRVASGLGVDLHRAIDEKMAINRARTWIVDGTGCGQHKDVP